MRRRKSALTEQTGRLRPNRAARCGCPRRAGARTARSASAAWITRSHRDRAPAHFCQPIVSMYLLREWEVERRYAPQWRVENPTSHFPLPTSHFPLPTTHYPLPTSHFPLPTSHFPLPTTHYLNFNVASPTNTSSIVMIQNLTTTCVSFQPFNS